MSLLSFFRTNARWLAGGFLLTFFSSFGQTFFIALSAGDIRSEYSLSHGGFGTLYMVATLGSALTLPWLGKIVDRISPLKVALVTMPLLAAGALSMAFSTHIVVLGLTIYVLRLFGQGMMTQNAFTATGRWFAANRGRAVSIVTLGHNAGEAVFPFLFVAATAWLGWRGSWIAASIALVVIGLPLIAALIRVERAPQADGPGGPVRHGRDWTRAEVLRDPAFWLLLAGVLTAPFIGTTIFFHQVYLVELRGWEMTTFAASFALMPVMTITFSLISGALIDRFSAIAMLPGFLLPLALACFALAVFPQAWAPFVFMGLMGISYGFSSTLFGALWPELYGLAHLGAIRSIVVAIMVFSTAAGPGLTGTLIDIGVSYPAQIMVMGLYCLAAAVVMWRLSLHLATRAALEKQAAHG